MLEEFLHRLLEFFSKPPDFGLPLDPEDFVLSPWRPPLPQIADGLAIGRRSATRACRRASFIFVYSGTRAWRSTSSMSGPMGSGSFSGTAAF